MAVSRVASPLACGPVQRPGSDSRSGGPTVPQDELPEESREPAVWVVGDAHRRADGQDCGHEVGDLRRRAQPSPRASPGPMPAFWSTRGSVQFEGMDRPEDCAKLVATLRLGGRDRVGCIALGRGEDDTRIRQWLKTAAAVPGFIGFSVGRMSFWRPLTEWKNGEITRDVTVSEIARRYREWVNIFEDAQTERGAAVAREGIA